MTAPRKLVPYDEAKQQLGGIGATKFHELLNNGNIERVKLGTRGFVTQDSIDRFIEELPRG